MDPQPVSGLEIGHLRNGQSNSGALHTNVDLGTDEVKGCVVGTGGGGKGQQSHRMQKQEKNERERHLAGALGNFILGECRETQEIILTDLRLGGELDGLQTRMGRTGCKTKRPRLS
jgi:hypothetical protein